MRDAITVTVSVSDLYKSLPSNARKINVEEQIKAMIKAEFERQGIRFLDKAGLYPAAPYHMKKEDVGAYPVITIKQGRA